MLAKLRKTPSRLRSPQASVRIYARKSSYKPVSFDGMIQTLAVSIPVSANEVLPLGSDPRGLAPTVPASLGPVSRSSSPGRRGTQYRRGLLAREGGLPSTLWAGPEKIARSVRLGEHEVQGTPRQNSVSLKLGFAGDPYSYCIDLGYPPPAQTAFPLDPAIKRECIWHGGIYRRASVLVGSQ